LNSSDAKKILSVFVSFFLALKSKLQVLKFEFCQVELEQQINLQLTGKISPKLDSNLSLLLEYGR